MSAAYDFSARMENAKAIAQDRRNRGLPTGKPAKGWMAKPAPMEDTPENRLYIELADLRQQLAAAKNEAASLRLNGGEIVESLDDDYGAEFDRLFAGEKVGRSLPVPPRSPRRSTTPARTRGATAMTKIQYLTALKTLDLTPSGQGTAECLGLSLRQCQRIAAGECAVPEPVAKLLRLMRAGKVTREDLA